MADGVETDNDDLEEQPRELTENEKNLNELMQAVSVFVHKYSKPEDLPPDGIVVSTHLGRIKLTFGEDPLKVVFMKQAAIQMACAVVTQVASTGNLASLEGCGEELSRQSFALAKHLWAKAEVLQ